MWAIPVAASGSVVRQRHIDTLGDQLRADCLSEGVRTDSSHHGGSHALSGARHGLVVPLAAWDHGERAPDNRLTWRRQPGRLRREIHRQTSNHHDLSHVFSTLYRSSGLY